MRYWITAVITLGACQLFTEPVPRADGAYALVRLREHPLPWYYAEIYSPNGTPTGCWAVATEGEVRLDARDRIYRRTTVFRDSCDGQILWEGIDRGSFVQAGTSLTFTYQEVGRTVSYYGRVNGDSVRVEFLDPWDQEIWINEFVKAR